jgi:energy-coupling factor transporter transmembrane protein EcfT
MAIAADPILLASGRWLGLASAGLLLTTVVAFVARWGVRFRLVGITSFTVLLCLSCLAFAVSYTPRVVVPGAVSVPVVYDNGGDLVVAAAPAGLPEPAWRPTVEQVARNLRGSGRTSADGRVHVRLRRLESEQAGRSRPVVLAEAELAMASGEVSLRP